MPQLNRSARPGVLSLTDAFQTADDFIVERTTRRSIDNFHRDFDWSGIGGANDDARMWRLILPRSVGPTEILDVYDHDLTLDGFKSRTAKDLGDFAAGDFSVAEVKVDARGKTGATLATQLLQHGLLDELLLYTHPAILGSGRPLFDEITAPLECDLLEHARFESGVALNRYQIRGQRTEHERKT